MRITWPADVGCCIRFTARVMTEGSIGGGCKGGSRVSGIACMLAWAAYLPTCGIQYELAKRMRLIPASCFDMSWTAADPIFCWCRESGCKPLSPGGSVNFGRKEAVPKPFWNILKLFQACAGGAQKPDYMSLCACSMIEAENGPLSSIYCRIPILNSEVLAAQTIEKTCTSTFGLGPGIGARFVAECVWLQRHWNHRMRTYLVQVPGPWHISRFMPSNISKPFPKLQRKVDFPPHASQAFMSCLLQNQTRFDLGCAGWPTGFASGSRKWFSRIYWRQRNHPVANPHNPQAKICWFCFPQVLGLWILCWCRVFSSSASVSPLVLLAAPATKPGPTACICANIPNPCIVLACAVEICAACALKCFYPWRWQHCLYIYIYIL